MSEAAGKGITVYVVDRTKVSTYRDVQRVGDELWAPDPLSGGKRRYKLELKRGERFFFSLREVWVDRAKQAQAVLDECERKIAEIDTAVAAALAGEEPEGGQIDERDEEDDRARAENSAGPAD